MVGFVVGVVIVVVVVVDSEVGAGDERGGEVVGFLGVD